MLVGLHSRMAEAYDVVVHGGVTVRPDIQIRGMGEMTVTLRNLPEQIGDGKKNANKIGGQHIVKFWKMQLSGPAGTRRLGVRTGESRASIRAQQVQTGGFGGSTGTKVGTDKKHLRIHEFGGKTPATVIRPRIARALRFMQNGKLRFAKKVNHPGSRIPARPHRAPAVKAVWPVLEALFDGELQKALDRSLAIGRRLGRAQTKRFNQALRRGLTGRRG